MAMADATETLFDTHAHVRALIAAGMPERQAEAVVRLQVDVLQRHIVTKADAAAIRSDIAALRNWSENEFGALKKDIAALRTWTETEFEALKKDVSQLKEDVSELKKAKLETIKWVAGLNITTAALVVAAVKIL